MATKAVPTDRLEELNSAHRAMSRIEVELSQVSGMLVRAGVDQQTISKIAHAGLDLRIALQDMPRERYKIKTEINR